ncbi:Crp/Fnr family transcriptional regulator [Bradyrhizobium sp. JR3.5]
MTEKVPAVIKPLDSSADAVGSATEPMLFRPGTGRSNGHLFVKNSILARLSLQDLAAIGTFLEPIALRERMVLQEPKRPFNHVYFIESGLVSLRIVAPGSLLEAAVVGYRGAVGVSLVVGGNIPTQQSVVLFPGHALRIHANDLRRVTTERPKILEHLLRYSQTHNTHCAQMGLCGVRHGLEPRLACWLCLMCDALDSNVLPITHDYVSAVLGLHRAGVTRTLIRFEEQGLIRKMRGVLQVDDGGCLEQKACCCHGVITGAYTSLEHPEIAE